VEQDSGGTRQATSRVTADLGAVIILILIALGVLLAYRIYPGSSPRQSDPGVIDIIFANNLCNRRTLRENRDALDDAGRRAENWKLDARRSRLAVERAVRGLRRAGLLK
jgi:hypothetical protein